MGTLCRPLRCWGWHRLGIGVALILSVALSGCGGDGEQIRLCQSLIPAFEGRATIDILRQDADPSAAHAIIVEYRTTGAADRDGDHWILCRFAGGTLDADRLVLEGVATDREGALTPVRLHMLKVWLGLFDRSRPPAGPTAGPTAESTAEPGGQSDFPAAYILQQLVNAIAISCVYGLLAIGYTLVYGIVGRINLAFGQLAMAGAFATVIGTAILAALGGWVLPLSLLSVLVLAMLVGAVHGWATERLVFRPTRGIATQSPLIATIGLAIALQEYVRLVQGSRDRWLQPIFTDRVDLLTTDGFTASIGVGQIMVLTLTALLFAALHLLLTRTGLGRAQRACADDSGMAALVGVDVDRTIGRTFLIGGVNFFMGHLIGFKALAAAIVGGIGSVWGALLGGLLIGLLETFWSGYLDIAYKDIAVFGLLTIVLIYRPAGLLGKSTREGV